MAAQLECSATRGEDDQFRHILSQHGVSDNTIQCLRNNGLDKMSAKRTYCFECEAIIFCVLSHENK